MKDIASPAPTALAKSFEPAAIEAQWYSRVWEARGYYRAGLDHGGRHSRIQLPPPNVTGPLHMGHAFQHTMMDVLIRYHRMRGDNTLWQPGTDHAGIATQIVVEQQLEAEGHRPPRRSGARSSSSRSGSGRNVRRHDHEPDAPAGRLGRLARASASRWTTGFSRVVTEDVRAAVRAGPDLSRQAPRQLGPEAATAVSDLEVESEEEDGKIWEIRYPAVDGAARRRFGVVVATTRPETMLGDVAVAVNPEDERYAALVGKTVALPLTGRTIPIIADDYVDPEFGTGCVKITPAHDFNDFAVGQRHRLRADPDLHADATVNDNAPEKYRGLDRYVARKRVLADLRAAGLLVSEKPHKMIVPRCGRTGEVVEPMLTDQWYMAMSKPAPAGTPHPGKSIAQVALEAVARGDVRIRARAVERGLSPVDRQHPGLVHLAAAVVGPPDPGVVRRAGNVYVARSEAAARRTGRSRRRANALTRDEDVLDTWFSSAYGAFSTLGWPESSDRRGRDSFA